MAVELAAVDPWNGATRAWRCSVASEAVIEGRRSDHAACAEYAACAEAPAVVVLAGTEEQ